MRSAISAGVGARPSSRAISSADPVDLDRQLLEVARDADRPALVAEVALDLAEDRRHRERRERRLAGRVEAVDRLQQPERRDLDQVVELLAAALVAAGELARQRQEPRDERLARGGVALAVVAHQQPAVLVRARRPVSGRGVLWDAAVPATVFVAILDALHAHGHAARSDSARRGVGALDGVERVAGLDCATFYCVRDMTKMSETAAPARADRRRGQGRAPLARRRARGRSATRSRPTSSRSPRRSS